MPVQLEQRLLNVDEYYRMTEAGILAEDERIELLNGQIIRMSPIGSKHAAYIEKIAETLRPLLIDKTMLRTQNPVRLDQFNQPESDIAIVIKKENYYEDAHPVPKEIFLLIEVADASIDIDRTVKKDLYAKFNIANYWIIDIENRQIEVYRSPRQGQYLSTQIFLEDHFIEMVLFEESISVKELLI